MVKNERGISPIVGTILLIAITVSLAAVVAVIVGRLGAPTPAPSVVLAVSAENKGSGNMITLTIKHRGGDSIKSTELKVWAEDNTGALTDVTANVTWGDGTEPFSAGEEGVGDYTYGATPTVGDYIKVRVVHIPTGGVLYESDRVKIE